ncbi:MAG: class I SAM-dependent methyltransferase [Patescibacteria group bacterium]|nr:class I SAM-dependent methyltransferase [Patescibacteria group bacterium]
MYFAGFLQKTGLWQRLVLSNQALGWFNEFRKFWVGCLENRPIDVFDFHYLRNVYRSGFQGVSVENEKAGKKFEAAWQESPDLFLLFQAIWHYGQKAYLTFYPFLKYIPKGAGLLEYGCGIAPVTQGLIKYCSYKKLKFTIADIRQINFLYARWKLSFSPNVNFITIDSALPDNLPANELYDVIICLTVFEHLPNPLSVAQSFYSHLRTNGILIFDYVKQAADGLDTKAGQGQRNRVLQFVEKNFKVIEGKIDYENNMGLTIAKKQQQK